MKFVLSFFLYLAIFLSSNLYTNHKTEDLSAKEIIWNWKNINTDQISFPKNFIFGFGTSEYQVSGAENCPHSNWAMHEKNTKLNLSSGKACDHWNLYKHDIQLMKQFGANAYRFSIEWSRVEPIPGYFDKHVIQHYHDLIDNLLTNKIVPVITLHHFTHPYWFEEKKAFEKEENINLFIRFCKRMFIEFGSKVNIWCTINEPGVYAFQAYLRGVYPPCKKMHFKTAGQVTLNLIKSHIEVYKELKSMPYGNKAQIGIVHNITQFDPYDNKSWVNNKISKYLNNMFYDAILQFFITGEFNFIVPASKNIKYKYENPKNSLDFIGLNYYSHALINWKNSSKPTYRQDEIPTDMPYGIYAEGFYRAINQVSKIGVPIYITENGISDSKDDRREMFLKRYLYALNKAIKDGYDVRGYFYWSLLDNFEWDLGYNQKFGLFEVDLKTQKRTLRKGAQYYKYVLDQHKKNS